jgi:hypothetical protein
MQKNTKIMMATTAILTVLGVGIYLLTQEDSNALVKTNNIGNDAIIKDNSNLKNIVSNNKNKSLKKIKQNDYYSHYNPKLTNLENWKLWLNNLKNGDSSYNNFEKRIADILRNLPAGDNIFYSDIYDLFLHDTPSGPKKLIISILGSAATKESAELLYKLIDDGLLESGHKYGFSSVERAAREAIRTFANQKWVYGKPNHHVAKVMEKNWQGLQNIMLYHATADSLAYIGEDSSLDLFFDEFLSVTDPIKIKILNQSVKNFTRGHNNPQIKDKLKHHLGSFKKNDERSRIQRQVSGLLLATTGDARDKEAVLLLYSRSCLCISFSYACCLLLVLTISSSITCLIKGEFILSRLICLLIKSLSSLLSYSNIAIKNSLARPYTDYKKFESCVVAIHGTIYIGIYGYVGGSYKLLGGRKSNCVNP